MAFVNTGVIFGKRSAAIAKCAEKDYGDYVLNKDEAVAPMKTIETVPSGKQVAVCRCWYSGNMPFCDGSHNKHNAQAGDKLGPLVVKAAKPE